MAASTIQTKPGRGDAHFSVQNTTMTEYFDVVNAILRNGATPIGATGSCDVHWRGNGQRMHVENDNVGGTGLGFAGQYHGADIDISWSLTNANGYAFSTVDPNEAPPVITSAFTAQVRTGIFSP